MEESSSLQCHDCLRSSSIRRDSMKIKKIDRQHLIELLKFWCKIWVKTKCYNRMNKPRVHKMETLLMWITTIIVSLSWRTSLRRVSMVPWKDGAEIALWYKRARCMSIRMVVLRHKCSCKRWVASIKSKNQLETKQIWKSASRARASYWAITYEMVPSHKLIEIHLEILKSIVISSILVLCKLTVILILIQKWTKWLWHQIKSEVYATRTSGCCHKTRWASAHRQHSRRISRSPCRHLPWCASRKMCRCPGMQICCMIIILQTMGAPRRFSSEHPVSILVLHL